VFLRAIPDQPQGMIVSTPGLIGLVRFGEQLVPIDDAEIDRVRTVADSALAVQPWPYLAHGSKVTIVRGALSGISGTIQRIGEKTVLVVSVEILQRSVAVHLDRSWIEPAKTFVHVESAIVGRSRGQAVVPTRSVSLNRLS